MSLRSRQGQFIVALCAFVALLVPAQPAAATISYTVSLAQPANHLFRVQMTIPDPAKGIIVSLPTWNALYQIRDFAYRVRDVRAFASSPDGLRYDVRKLDKQTWKVEYGSPPVPIATPEMIIEYSVEWDDPGPFSSQLNEHHAFINLAEILMYVPDRRGEEAVASFVQVPNDWKIAVELPATPMMNAPDTFTAATYDALVDAPVEAGKFDEFKFDSGGGHFRVIVDAAGWNRGRLETALRRITAYEIELMGGAPFQEYTFFFHIGPAGEVGGGGMEHVNSSEIADGSLDGAISIAAHEFFHAWNVKRIRPQSLEPVDYTKEQYTRALWFAEGVTDTYRSYTLERTGIWAKGRFYDDLASQIERLQMRPAHAWQSVEESSLDAWFEKYSAYNLPDRSISYYNKGQIIGVLLDLEIREATDNHKSLDDVMRLLNDEYARQGKFYDDSNGVRAAAEKVAGKSFEDFFRRYISGVDEIPYNEVLSFAGLELKSDGAYSISEIAHPTDRQRCIREGLLHGSTD
jgi:predicted metalloprotease with PDZ domain